MGRLSIRSVLQPEVARHDRFAERKNSEQREPF